ncbi:uncharacterized protein TRIADDRAFT_29004 [Trichoplax adhaerens]|uniref:G-protein coupled receptors family 1 profile domain-containing protein n=1 Tax=Trichoplax adhaerens TaxID=10228 RepID=B3S599_TRIAD|nr:hypothetical protein TRIADDRAFT_29004 [Trichoplax adhaerens]EDV22226.1 hypothetical protein TRIADDRAFT_29004 [Trichoplax adhaerens]|eukprot:XP_002115381.1 hypothetical protein TRIADDRAFT_29004 [Trichoplax adhaerens]
MSNETLPRNDHLDIFITVLMVIASFTAVIGNLAVLILTYRYKILNSNANYLITNLAMSDFIVGAFTIPPFAISILLGHQIFFKPFCSISAYITNVCTQASILTVVCISVDRLISVLKPLKYPRYVTTNRTVIAITATWIMSLLMSAVPLFNLQHLGLGTYQYVDYLFICWIDVNLKVNNGIYLAITYTSTSICLLLVFISYVLIYREAMRNRRRIHLIRRLNLRDKMSFKTTKTTMVIVGTFLCCNLPSIVMILNGLINGKSSQNHRFEKLGLALVFTNSAANPIIYSLANKSYRGSIQAFVHDLNRYHRRQRATVMRISVGATPQRSSKSKSRFPYSPHL